MSLSKNKIGQVVRALTGHDFRKRHNNIGNKDADKACSMCGEQEETPEHIIAFCPRLTQIRQNIFQEQTADIFQLWTVNKMTEFLSNPLILEMEQQTGLQ